MSDKTSFPTPEDVLDYQTKRLTAVIEDRVRENFHGEKLDVRVTDEWSKVVDRVIKLLAERKWSVTRSERDNGVKGPQIYLEITAAN